MRLKIIHETKYNFSSEVYLEPHQLRLKPKSTSFCVLDSFDLEIHPNPMATREQIDPENNTIHFVWFQNKTKELIIRTNSLITISEYNPFTFIIFPSQYLQVPFNYTEELKTALFASLRNMDIDQSLKDYSSSVLEKSNNTIDFLTNLTQQIHNDFELCYRHEGYPFDPNKTFNLKKGSCRDLAWMQIHLFRNLGIAARFVSGYYYIKVDKPKYELHAWGELFIPGAGWVGFDPSYGVVTGNAHIALVSSSHFDQTMPVTGTIRGGGNSILNTTLYINEL
ncbi:transglutaminase family protein [Flavivirga amylovorans]|uniref:Transglutaminase family protein n=1 Tax=Flavivirga amylovorans TaxID=870486 RepID=A0ABT8X6Y0_9FLAO|nr:transglutaminase family protein [Flavivirga amylovorans]MDO5989758.1 transglutaminase family protein [Flavivirga amylovorans]